jgi:hypothetical protein
VRPSESVVQKESLRVLEPMVFLIATPATPQSVCQTVMSSGEGWTQNRRRTWAS